MACSRQTDGRVMAKILIAGLVATALGKSSKVTGSTYAAFR